MLKSVMENSRYEHHVMDLTCLHLDYGSKSNDLIHGHAELLGSCVILVVESVLHVVKESSDDGFRTCVDVEIISIRIKIAGKDEVSSFLDLDLRYKFIVYEKVRRIHAFVKFGIIEIKARFMQELLYLVICRAFRNGYLNGIRCECKEIHKLVIGKALEEIVRTCYVSTIKTIELAYDGEQCLICDKAFLIKLVCDIGCGITTLDNDSNGALGIGFYVIFSLFDIFL